MCINCAAASDPLRDPIGRWRAAGQLDQQSASLAPEGIDAFLSPGTNASEFGALTTGVGSTGDLRIDGVLSGVRWDLGVISYSFPDEALDYEVGYPRNAPLKDFGQISPTQQALLRLVMDSANYISVEGFTLLEFTDGGSSSAAQIRSAYSSDAGGSAYAYYPSGSPTGGDMWFGPFSGYNYATPVRGGQGWRSTLHELGHALGLKHGHEGGGPGGTAIPTEFDHHEYSIMTYRSYEGHGANGYTNETWGAPQSFMMLDIAGLQYMYGADFTFNGGASVYSFSPTTGEMFINGLGQGAPGGNRIFQTIWDGGGVDTYDLSNYATNLQIDLEPGSASLFSSVQQARLGPGQYARGNVYNALLFGGDPRSLIENAVGGAGDDTLRGNQGSNRLSGGAGDDTLEGGGGVDLLQGGDGSDTVSLAGSLQGVIVDLGSQATFDGVNQDNLSSIENAIGSVYADQLWGDEGGNRLEGGAGADTLLGHGGDDHLEGGLGFDVLHGGAGSDTVRLTSSSQGVIVDLTAQATFDGLNQDSLSSVENAVGSAHADQLWGDASGNVLEGGLGADVLLGGGGSDTVSLAGSAQGVIVDLFSQATFDGVNQDVLGSIENAIGSRFNDQLWGDDGANRLQGGGGADVLIGYGGPDTFVFTALSDSRVGGVDRVMDFTPGMGDLIDISAIDANGLLAGDQAFELVDAFSGARGQATLSYDGGANLTLLRLDENGDGVADFQLEIVGAVSSGFGLVL